MLTQNATKFQPLLRLLYPGGGVDLRGSEFLGARTGLESALQSVYPSGRFCVYAQSGEEGLEDATHFLWTGVCGDLGYELEVMQTADSSRVVVHRVMDAAQCKLELEGVSRKFMGGVR